MYKLDVVYILTAIQHPYWISKQAQLGPWTSSMMAGCMEYL